MKRSGPPKRKTPLKRSALPRPVAAISRVRANLPAVSAKRKAANAERRQVIAMLKAQTRTCQANPLLGAALRRMTTDAGRRPYLEALQRCHLHGPFVGHEPQKRSRRGSIVDPANIMIVCAPCNDFAEREVDAATFAGLLIPSSFERDRS